ncbi:RNA exonuclease 4-like [Anneissia japonica]|uniref:RNA exonuclease 4-like n=1 Tax=Anneissia japonica TaxID=1529436 RepID=UPI0014257E28|nr:RNA exonuclease 4-like [Anneissia japonica]XP_033097257.1 RNA exonuclease 4-like [Anneissia japonica]
MKSHNSKSTSGFTVSVTEKRCTGQQSTLGNTKKTANKQKRGLIMDNEDKSQQKVCMISGEDVVKEQSPTDNTQLPIVISSKRKHRDRCSQYENVDSNWKALFQTLPRNENIVAKFHKRKKVKIQKTDKKSVWKHEKEDDTEDIWFDDVDPSLLESCDIVDQQKSPVALVDDDGDDRLTRHVALDCEMVGIGYKGQDSVLARVSIVNEFGKCVYDKYVKARERVTDFRTPVSGIKPHHIKSGEDFKNVQKEVADILKDRIIIGHALSNDLKVLFLGHPKKNIRDTSEYKPFRRLNKGSKPSLKTLAKLILNINIQGGEHDSVEDARVAMRLYMLHKKEWEKSRKLKSKGLLNHQTKLHHNKDSTITKNEKRRKIKLFRLKNAQKKRR